MNSNSFLVEQITRLIERLSPGELVQVKGRMKSRVGRQKFESKLSEITATLPTPALRELFSSAKPIRFEEGKAEIRFTRVPASLNVELSQEEKADQEGRDAAIAHCKKLLSDLPIALSNSEMALQSHAEQPDSTLVSFDEIGSIVMEQVRIKREIQRQIDQLSKLEEAEEVARQRRAPTGVGEHGSTTSVSASASSSAPSSIYSTLTLTWDFDELEKNGRKYNWSLMKSNSANDVLWDFTRILWGKGSDLRCKHTCGPLFGWLHDMDALPKGIYIPEFTYHDGIDQYDAQLSKLETRFQPDRPFTREKEKWELSQRTRFGTSESLIVSFVCALRDICSANTDHVYFEDTMQLLEDDHNSFLECEDQDDEDEDQEED